MLSDLNTQFSHTDTIETSNCQFFWSPDGILNLITKSNSKTTLESAIEENDAIRQMTKGEPVLLVADIRNLTSVSSDAREYIKQPEIAGLYKAVAMIVDNVFSRVIGSFVLGFVSSGYPVKMFTNREKAIAWLESLDL